MIEESNEELTTHVSYEVIKEVSPRELPFFDDYKEEFLKNPSAFTETDPKKKEKMLGFGIPDGVTQLVTTFVLPIVLEAIKKYAAKRKEKSLNTDQLKQIKTEAYNNAIAMGMKKEKAELMANALLGQMIKL